MEPMEKSNPPIEGQHYQTPLYPEIPPGYQQQDPYSQPPPPGTTGYTQPPPGTPGTQPPSGTPGYYPIGQPPSYPGPGQQTVIVTSASPCLTKPRVYQSYAGHIALACFAFWCCGWFVGLVAFILAILASQSSSRGDDLNAVQLGRASLWVSVTGIIIGCIVIAVVVGITVTGRNAAYTAGNNLCYSSSGNYYYSCK